MADERGGYRRPQQRATYSGVGRQSRRTDPQPIRAPSVQNAEDLQQGDRKIIEHGQQVQRLSRQPAPNIRAAPAPAVAPLGGGGGALPEHLFASPSNRPGEPLTEGLAFGAGAGPEVLAHEPVDPKQEILHKLYAEFGDDWALAMLNEMRAPPAPAPTPELEPAELTEPGEPEPTELPYPEPAETAQAPEEASIEAVPADEEGEESAS